MKSDGGEFMKILIVSFDCDAEAAALRAALEWYHADVMIRYIGRPKDFLDVLEGDVLFSPDVLILCGHGDDGMFLMPELGEDVYLDGEPRNISPEDVRAHLKLHPKLCISTACTSGTPEMGAAFADCGVPYLAPDDYIEGATPLFFILHMFYLHLTCGKNFAEAVAIAKTTDSETAMYTFYDGKGGTL